MKVALIMASVVWDRLGVTGAAGSKDSRFTLDEKCSALAKATGRARASRIKSALIRQWLRRGPPHRLSTASALPEFCQAATRLLRTPVKPDWIIDHNLSVFDFAKQLGIEETDADYAIGHHLLNRDELPVAKQFMPSRRTIDTTLTHPYYGIYLATRRRIGGAKNQMSRCLLLIDRYIEHEEQGKLAVLAMLYVPSLNPGARVHKYIGTMTESDRDRHFILINPFDKNQTLVFLITNKGNEGDVSLAGKYLSTLIDGVEGPSVRDFAAERIATTISDAAVENAISRLGV